jgi:hypothetical protein
LSKRLYLGVKFSILCHEVNDAIPIENARRFILVNFGIRVEMRLHYFEGAIGAKSPCMVILFLPS